MHIQKEIREAMQRRQPVTVHLVSGETYRGICDYNDGTERLTVLTGTDTLVLPAWTIKRLLP
ncbi:hypothetical protein F4V43_12090 [Paenibacillus spiritus]|uniref:DUF2642 domain-containing protein n=1 Tax=Paenibacillus spiritus TaxID=2496557 RepID=A0A5J5G9J7_9BACL|nr:MULTISPECIES: hypothetical protein [Paenibacillus]KAA9004133.1 hypothetical protein F4V43_12090 [Paenibacillus spiritus]